MHKYVSVPVLWDNGFFRSQLIRIYTVFRAACKSILKTGIMQQNCLKNKDGAALDHKMHVT